LLGVIGQVGWLWLFSILWLTGFDIIYATMDEAFDRTAGLYSLPARIGKRAALRVALLLHLLAFVSLCAMWETQLQSTASVVWLVAIGALFIWQHAVAERRPEFAFFHLNGILGFFVLGFVLAGLG
jgi:4-hydroxybenzoate polyprenyltransferase